MYYAYFFFIEMADYVILKYYLSSFAKHQAEYFICMHIVLCVSLHMEC